MVSAIEPKVLGAIALGLLLTFALGALLIRAGRKSRSGRSKRRQSRIGAVPTPRAAQNTYRPATAPQPVRAGARSAQSATPLIAPGPTVLPADAAVIDLRVSFEETAYRPSVRPLARPAVPTTVSIVVVNGDPSVLLRSIASELAKVSYYLRPERPFEGWLSSVYDRQQNQVGELAASKDDPTTSTIKLSMREYGASFELVDRAIQASGFTLLTRDRVQDRYQFSYVDRTGGRVRASLSEPVSQQPKMRE